MNVHSHNWVVGRGLSVVAGSLVCLLLSAPLAQAEIVADSFDDWSFDGIQGDLDWYNGYYNLTQDADRIFQADDFIDLRFEQLRTDIQRQRMHRLVNSRQFVRHGQVFDQSETRMDWGDTVAMLLQQPDALVGVA